MKQASVVLADDHVILLEGLRNLLQFEFDLVATARDGRSLVKEVLRQKPDIAVVDISMPELNGLDALRQLKKNKELRTRFVILTATLDPALAAQAMQLGAHAYVLKHSAGEELITAIRMALEGRTFVTPRLASEVMEGLLRGANLSRGPVLTRRERQVLKLLAEGKSAKEIGGGA